MLFRNPRLIKLFFRYIRSYNKSKRTLKIVLESAVNQVNHSPTLKKKLTLDKGKKTPDEIYIKFRLGISPIFDAYVQKIDESAYYLHMNYGIFFKIYDILNVLLSEKNINFYNLVSGEKEYNNIKADKFFDILYEYALKVVICHELGHVVNGHIDYLNNLGLGKKNRYHLNDELNNNILDRLFIEMDADNFSSATITSQLIYDKNIEYYNQEVSLIKHTDHAKFLLIIASSIVYASLNYYCHNNKLLIENDVSKLEYLPGRLRYYSYYIYLLDYFHALMPDDIFFLKAESFNKEILNLEHFTYLYFRDVLGNKVYFNKIAVPISDDDINTVIKLEEDWNKHFKKKLQKYSYLPIL